VVAQVAIHVITAGTPKDAKRIWAIDQNDGVTVLAEMASPATGALSTDVLEDSHEGRSQIGGCHGFEGGDSVLCACNRGFRVGRPRSQAGGGQKARDDSHLRSGRHWGKLVALVELSLIILVMGILRDAF